MTKRSKRRTLAPQLSAVGALALLISGGVACGAKDVGQANQPIPSRSSSGPGSEADSPKVASRSQPSSAPASSNLSSGASSGSLAASGKQGYRDSSGEDDVVVVVARRGGAPPASSGVGTGKAATAPESDLGLVASCEERNYVEGQDAQSKASCVSLAGDNERESSASKE